MGKIIQFPILENIEEENDKIITQEIMKVIEESYKEKEEAIDEMYKNFYDNQAEVEDFYHVPY